MSSTNKGEKGGVVISCALKKNYQRNHDRKYKPWNSMQAMSIFYGPGFVFSMQIDQMTPT